MDFNEVWLNTCSTVGMACRIGDISSLRNFLEAGRPVDVCDNRGWQPLHEAAFHGRLDCIELLCSRDEIDFNWKTFKGETALLLAATKGLTDVCRVLIEHGADPDSCDLMRMTPLMAAAKSGHLPLVEMLVEASCSVNQQDDDTKSTPLHHAIAASSPEVVEYLLSKKADLYLVDEHNRSPVFTAAEMPDSIILLLLLDEAQKRGETDVVNVVASDGASPLMIAAQKGSPNCVEMLIDYGADVNLVTNDYVMALHLAVVGQSVDCVEMVLKRTDRSVLRCYSFAPSCEMLFGPCRCNACVESPDIRKGASVLNFGSPFHLAVGRENIPILKLLMNSDLDPNEFLHAYHVCDVYKGQNLCSLLPPNGVTAVGYAVEVQNSDVLEVLLQGGCRADPDSFRNVSALSLAVNSKWLPGVELLLKYGADPNFPMKLTRMSHPYTLFVALQNLFSMLRLRRAGGDLRLCFDRTSHSCVMLTRVLRNVNIGGVLHFFSSMGTNAITELSKCGLNPNILLMDVMPLKCLAEVAVRNYVLDSGRENFLKKVRSLSLPIELENEVSLENVGMVSSFTHILD